MINWLKKKMMKSILDEALKNLPALKNKALEYWSGHKDEIFKEVKEKIVELIKSKIGC